MLCRIAWSGCRASGRELLHLSRQPATALPTVPLFGWRCESFLSVIFPPKCGTYLEDGEMCVSGMLLSHPVTDLIYTGNAKIDGEERRGWILGHLK